jgi:predicted RNA-binding protein with PUA-like domain
MNDDKPPMSPAGYLRGLRGLLGETATTSPPYDPDDPDYDPYNPEDDPPWTVINKIRLVDDDD